MRRDATCARRVARWLPGLAGLLLSTVVTGLPGDARAGTAEAGSAAPAASQSQPQNRRSVDEWLVRLHEASRGRAYQGTFVVSSSSGASSSARIWHVCDGQQQMERVESLTGVRRTTFRRDDEVVTFLPDSRLVRRERRAGLAAFPALLQSPEATVARYYDVKLLGVEPVAGLDADVIEFVPRDGFRYGHRAWSEKRSGLVLKVQTLGAGGRVLEQASFSQLQLDAPVRMEVLQQAMSQTSGYRVEASAAAPTSAEAEGWALKQPVPGFRSAGCYRRPSAGGSAGPDESPTVQWVFTDGLASVSLFLEAYNPGRHVGETVLLAGATRTLTRRITDSRGRPWWLTAMGEVPTRTLEAFSGGLERSR